MIRSVSVHLDIELAGRTDLVFDVGVARGASVVHETLDFSIGDQTPDVTEIVDPNGSRLHSFESGAGTMSVDYRVEVEGRATPAPVDELELITYLRPSRYCQSDSLSAVARSEFWGLTGHNLLAAVVRWVSARLSYVSGSSEPTDGAVQTLAAGRGVCRDYAHLVIALLRALDVPARMVAVYAPGLEPMDFHAVVEAHVDGQWWLVDATHLAPRQSMLRISTGRDAADIAFLTNHGADLTLTSMSVLAVVDDLPFDDGLQLVQLG
ncbi:transglutaminase-like putative cysteine protease [Leifsonia sp. AK011]|uniref:transglutaminase-like domain-containing protein n=1 Tax=Leifsonia sp. AK011 TaxID=2723075 RepID=UPI0015C8E0E6|nr:transglutaminase family protein [Leifsonia sp. AK011]NYF10329.1 transglutaminase-like putative cysteine protease [Leifsonia sp. AK011]